MCSSRIANGKHNFVFLDDEDYGKHNVFFLWWCWWRRLYGKHNVFFLWWCWWRRLYGKHNLCSSSDDVDDEDYGKHNVFFLSSTWEMFVSIRLNKKTVVIPDKKGIYGFFCSNDTVWLDIVLQVIMLTHRGHQTQSILAKPIRS